MDSLQNRNLISELHFASSRSSGPGGQNVNKVNSRIELRFHIDSSTLLSQEEKERLHFKLKNRINSEGDLIMFSQSERSQLKNKENVTERFLTLIEKALQIEKKRKPTKPTLVARLKRLEGKKYQAQKKEDRKSPDV